MYDTVGLCVTKDYTANTMKLQKYNLQLSEVDPGNCGPKVVEANYNVSGFFRRETAHS